jgi:hypothetical protein
MNPGPSSGRGARDGLRPATEPGVHAALAHRPIGTLPLERRDAQTIEQIEYLPGEQLPVAEGAKLSILDVRCKDRAGTMFVVEMQLIHHPGFINRVVYNACKAYAGQLKAGDWYTKLTDVVAISICDFELWPDAKQDTQGLPRVPMLSRWHIVRAATAASVEDTSRSVVDVAPRLPTEVPTPIRARPPGKTPAPS